MYLIRVTLTIMVCTAVVVCNGQSNSVFQVESQGYFIQREVADSIAKQVQEIPSKYIQQVSKKIGTYSLRISSKTEKTLTKLSRWENKIKKVLEKSSPEAASKLFAPGLPTFTTLLQQFKSGSAIAVNSTKIYDEYCDKLSTQLKYLAVQKSNFDSVNSNQFQKANSKMKALDEQSSNSDAVAAFIKERKKQLLEGSIKYLGKSKYLKKIKKESYYYVEALKNYQEIFKDKKKAEQTAIKLLDKIPAFKKFTQQNSMLASLFRSPGESGTAANLAGLQTRPSVNALIRQRIIAGGPNGSDEFKRNLQAAQAEFSKKKEKFEGGADNGTNNLPDFKPNMQKAKTFLQRLELGTNIQFGKGTGYVPTCANLGLQVAYKITDKSLAGVGIAYKMGLGKIDKIKFTSEGIGLRSFIDWKIQKQLFVSGGFELNHQSRIYNMAQLDKFSEWENSGLIGIGKSYNAGKKLKGEMKLLWDFLSYSKIPRTQALVFRVGYKFK
jgi:hypothetical protein